MPIHNWTSVIPGVFHDFHHEWIGTIKRGLNAGRLPPGYYAMAEQIAGGLAVATVPPKVRFTATSEMDSLARKRNRVVIRHSSGHRVVESSYQAAWAGVPQYWRDRLEKGP